jgi:nickel-dependent lactate racemase
MKTVKLLYDRRGMKLRLPNSTAVLVGREIPALTDAHRSVAKALARPIDSPPLKDLVAARKPRSVAITVSDITRPVPNRQFLPPMLSVLNRAGVADGQIVIIIGTGMHRPSTPKEREIILGREILRRLEVIDHRADDEAALVDVSTDPPVSVCRRFAEADFRIVTGYIEGHFMAGFSGGRKGVCPALVDLKTIQRFHGYEALSNPLADTGRLKGNPCHEIALRIAKRVGVDFLFNVAVTGKGEIAGIYCGDLVGAHLAGCKQVGEWTTAKIDGDFDLVVTSGGGYPLDATFYQTVKCMCAALPALSPRSTLLVVSGCSQGLGSGSYAWLMLEWNNDWRGFLADIEANRDVTRLDQWEFQMQCRVLDRIGVGNLWFVSDGIVPQIQRRISVRPILRRSDARTRAQRAVDRYLAKRPDARIAVIPEGPYTMLSRG